MGPVELSLFVLIPAVLPVVFGAQLAAGFGTVIVNLVLLVVGAVMDTASAIVITASVLAAAAEAYGYDRAHLGVIMIINMEIGILTTPMGTNIIVAVTAFNERFGVIVRSVIPWIGVLLLCLMMVTLFPWIALGLL